ncbi:MAG: FeoB-associated Cys-rich membrane protein [Spirochaetia bacterium]|nr:FeoB-associated Cys-rich membrane protein [Spirochaetia bacterium]
MVNIIVVLVIALILGLSIAKMVRDKKKGVVCSGCSACPMSGSCDSPTHDK